jgi:hypothetical protein
MGVQADEMSFKFGRLEAVEKRLTPREKCAVRKIGLAPLSPEAELRDDSAKRGKG